MTSTSTISTGTTSSSSASIHEQQVQSGMHPVCWQRPQHVQVKCNVDASFSEQLNMAGIGMCICYDDGTFVLAKTISILIICVVNVGEALDLYYALEWLSDLIFDNVEFVSYSKLIKYAFNHHRSNITEFGEMTIACR
jgi:ribonuclease HI